MAFSIRTPSLKVIGRKLKMKSKFLVSSVKLSAAMALLLMSGCAEYHKRVLDCTEPKGNEFCDTLAKEYKILGDTEQSIMYDEISADYYYRKALKASKECDSVLPACLEDWDIPEDKLAELQTARARLVRALANGARRDAPKMTAYAQAHFDCWVEQQAEGWQKLDIAHCRSEFYASMAEVEVMLMGGFTNVSPSNMVFFDLESAKVKDEDKKTLENVAQEALAKENSTAHILLVGRTDKAGDAKYNENLSSQRAMNVKKELVRRGVSPERIAIKAEGETPGPNVDTHNRRVDITFLEYK